MSIQMRQGPRNFQQYQPQPQPLQPPIGMPVKKSSNIFVILAIVVILGIIGTLIFLWYQNNTPDDTTPSDTTSGNDNSWVQETGVVSDDTTPSDTTSGNDNSWVQETGKIFENKKDLTTHENKVVDFCQEKCIKDKTCDRVLYETATRKCILGTGIGISEVDADKYQAYNLKNKKVLPPPIVWKRDDPDVYNPEDLIAHTNAAGEPLTGDDKYRLSLKEEECTAACVDVPDCRIVLYDVNLESCLMGKRRGDKIVQSSGLNRYSKQIPSRPQPDPAPESSYDWTKDDTQYTIGKYIKQDGNFSTELSLTDCKKLCEDTPDCKIIRHDSYLNCRMGSTVGEQKTKEQQIKQGDSDVISYQLTR